MIKLIYKPTMKRPLKLMGVISVSKIWERGSIKPYSAPMSILKMINYVRFWTNAMQNTANTKYKWNRYLHKTTEN